MNASQFSSVLPLHAFYKLDCLRAGTEQGGPCTTLRGSLRTPVSFLFEHACACVFFDRFVAMRC